MTTTESNTDTTAFNAIVAEWEHPKLCEANTKSGTPCRRPARVLVNVHGCEVVPTCTQHYRAHTAAIEAAEQGEPRGCYFSCGLVATWAASHTVVRI